MAHARIPEKVLAAGRLERCEWFSQRILDHPRMREVREKLLRALEPSSPTQVIAVCGPTGVGKSTLMKSVARTLRKQYAGLGPGSTPVVEMECPWFESRPYDFNRQHWIRLLQAMGDHFVNDHFDPDEAAKRRRGGIERIAAGRRSSGADLRLAAERYLNLRQTRAVFLDEAQHMVSIRASGDLHEHMDVIKSFGNATGVKQVLFGTEKLCELLRRNAQLARRTEEIFFPPYYAGSNSGPDLESFSTIFGQLFLTLPVAKPARFNLAKHFDEVYMRSAGCVGILKDWLSRALDHTLHSARESVSIGDLKATVDSDARLKAVVDGIVEFRRFTDDQPSLSSIRSQLRMPPPSSTPGRRPSVPRSRRPGQRDPHHDRVPRPGEEP